MSVDLVWLSFKDDIPPSGYWDHGLLEQLFSRDLWNPVNGYEFEHTIDISTVKTGAVVVFPARNQVDCLDQLNAALARLKWVVLILTGDEANDFPIEKITHPNIKFWVMSANPDRHGKDVRKLGSGYPPQALDFLPQYEKEAITKPLDYYFAGQITHERRQQCAAALEIIKEHQVNNHFEGLFTFTDGFTKGEPHDIYYRNMASAKTVPCPSGPESPDSFRLFEALEAGAVPIADAYSPKLKHDDYWTYIFAGQPPFPVFTDYDQLTGYIMHVVEHYPMVNNRVFAWWQNYKRQLAYWLEQDIHDLSGQLPTPLLLKDKITVIIPTSPIKDHPSTKMIERTVDDIRSHLPSCEIIIGIDGVRPEQEHYRADYEKYIQRLLWKANNQWQNVLPVIFDEHMHQAKMAKVLLAYVKTPALLYVEHDAPLTPDRVIQWDELLENILDGTANIIRFSHESYILPEHKHLILSSAENHHGALLTKTQQWSQRPHLASTAFYRHMIDTYFHPESKTMIEDVIHQIVEMDMRANGTPAWFNWRIWLYTPDEADIKRSYHLDGRGNDPKFEMDIKPIKRPL